MSDSNTSGSAGSGGIGIGTVLCIVFVVLKLVGVISWSWWWVLSPLWISVALFGAVLLLAATVMGIAAIFRSRRRGW